MIHYLDNAATSRVLPAAAEAAVQKKSPAMV